MGPRLVDYLLYDVEEDTGILWIKFKPTGADECTHWHGGRKWHGGESG